MIFQDGNYIILPRNHSRELFTSFRETALFSLIVELVTRRRPSNCDALMAIKPVPQTGIVILHAVNFPKSHG
jgi:hypothetical protein